MEIRYEDLVADLERSVRAMCEFLGVEFEPAMLDHASANHSLFENPYNHPSYKQAAQPVNASAVGRYRDDLSPEEIATFNRIVAAAALLEFAPLER
jgi:Sulfotransferase domain